MSLDGRQRESSDNPVRELRNRLRWTQRQLADYLQYRSTSQISLWESGDRPIPADQCDELQELARQHGFRIDFLTYLDEEPSTRAIRRSIATLSSDFKDTRDVLLSKMEEEKRRAVPLFAGVPSKPSYFVGRGQLMDLMIHRLVSGESLALSAEGLPGVGKTALAISLAYSDEVRQHFKDGVLWAGLGQQPDVMTRLAAWAEALGTDVSDLDSEQERSRIVRDTIGQRQMLLVIDDAWQLEAAALLRCGGPNCCHLLTTRDQTIARDFAGDFQVETLPALDDDAAYDLLSILAAEACCANPQVARELAVVVGGLPLALELLGGYLAAPERSYFTDLRDAAIADLYDPSVRLSLAQRRLGEVKDAKLTLQATITLSLEGLPQEMTAAFYALGAFASRPEYFDQEAARTVAGTSLTILALLCARNLVQRSEGDLLSLHQTLADVARTGMKADAASRHCNYYLDLVNKDQEDWRTIEAAYGQIKWAWNTVPSGDAVIEFVEALNPHFPYG